MSEATVLTVNIQPMSGVPENTAVHDIPQPVWSPLVERIRAGDPAAMEELYGLFSKGIRFYLCRQLGPQDLDDRVHDVFLTITQASRAENCESPNV